MATHIPLEKQLRKLLNKKNIGGMTLSDGTKIEDLLLSQARLLIEIIKEEIDNRVYAQPESEWYERTGDLKNSVDENVSVDPKTNTVTVGFIDELAWHDSAITKYRKSSYNHPAYVPLMVENGFHTLDTSGERWLLSDYWYEGTGFMAAAIRRFEQVKHKNISVKYNPPEKWW